MNWDIVLDIYCIPCSCKFVGQGNLHRLSSLPREINSERASAAIEWYEVLQALSRVSRERWNRGRKNEVSCKLLSPIILWTYINIKIYISSATLANFLSFNTNSYVKLLLATNNASDGSTLSKNAFNAREPPALQQHKARDDVVQHTLTTNTVVAAIELGVINLPVIRGSIGDEWWRYLRLK